MNSTKTLQPLSEEEAARLQTDQSASSDSGTADAADADAPSAEEPISKDELFHLLQNSRRRAVLRYLRGREGPVRMRDVAEQVAAWEHDTTVAQLSSNERQRVYIALYQSHLDTLADAGVIAYNKPRGVIEPLPLLDQVTRYLDVDRLEPTESTEADEDGYRTEWDRWYLAVSALGTLLVSGSALDSALLGGASGFAAAVVILLLFSVLTLAKLTLDGGRAEPTEDA